MYIQYIKVTLLYFHKHLIVIYHNKNVLLYRYTGVSG